MPKPRVAWVAAGSVGASALYFRLGSRPAIIARNTTPGRAHGLRLLHAQRQSLRRQPAPRTPSSPTSLPRRSTPMRCACIWPGLASIISTRSASSPARTSCSPISPRARSASGSLPPSRCCRCIIRSASPSNGRPSTPLSATSLPPQSVVRALGRVAETHKPAEDQAPRRLELMRLPLGLAHRKCLMRSPILDCDRSNGMCRPAMRRPVKVGRKCSKTS